VQRILVLAASILRMDTRGIPYGALDAFPLALTIFGHNGQRVQRRLAKLLALIALTYENRIREALLVGAHLYSDTMATACSGAAQLLVNAAWTV